MNDDINYNRTELVKTSSRLTTFTRSTSLAKRGLDLLERDFFQGPDGAITFGGDCFRFDPTPDMEAIVKADAGKLAEHAKLNVVNSVLAFETLDAYGFAERILREAYSDAGMDEPRLTFGRILTPEKTTVFRKKLNEFKDIIAKHEGYTDVERQAVEKFSRAFEFAARTGKKDYVGFALPVAVAEVAVHMTDIEQMVTDSIEASNSQKFLDGVRDLKVYKASTIEKKYKNKSDAIKSIEFVAKVRVGGWDDLGIDPKDHVDELYQLIKDYKKDFEAVNGKVDWKMYESINEVTAFWHEHVFGRESERATASKVADEADKTDVRDNRQHPESGELDRGTQEKANEEDAEKERAMRMAKLVTKRTRQAFEIIDKYKDDPKKRAEELKKFLLEKTPQL